MKKAKKVVLILLCVIMGNAKAIEPTINYQEGIYGNKVQGGRTFYGQLGIVKINERLAYCLEPYKLITTNYQVNSNYNNFSKEDLEYFGLVYQFGYNTTNHNNVYYYMAAQELIWRRITNQDVYWTTKNETKGDRINVDSYKNEILNEISRFNKKISFPSQTIRGNFRDVIVLEDTNNVLGDYVIYNDGPNYAWRENNKLYIKLMSSQEKTIRLEKKTVIGENKFYTTNSNDGQTLGSFGINDTKTVLLNVKAINKYSMKLQINFKDKITHKGIHGNIRFRIKNLDDGTYLRNAVFGTIGDFFSTDFDIEEGKYQVEMLDIPANYVLNDPLKFEITEDPEKQVLIIDDYFEKTTGRIEINRSFDMTEMAKDITPVSNMSYEIFADEDIYDGDGLVYSKDSKVEELTTDINGKAISSYLPLGNYYIKETSTKENITPYDDIYHISLEYKDNKTKEIIEQADIKTKMQDFDFNLNIKEKTITCDDKKCNNKQKPLSNIEYGVFTKDDIYLDGEKVIDKDILITRLKSNEDGNINEKLYLLDGNYVVKELTDMSSYNEKYNDIEFNSKNKKIDINLIKTKNIYNSNAFPNTNDKYLKYYIVSFLLLLLGIIGIINGKKN